MRKTSFYFSFLSLSRPRRQAITAVWDFCRAVDDAVDLETDPARARMAMDAWRADIARMFDGRSAETPEARALQPFLREFNLPRAQFDALVDGVSMDIDPIRYQTFEDLQPYCHRVASAVGLICAEIFGYQDRRVLDYARDLGVALQLTNILRDVGVDYRRGRLYLPLDDLARFGCTEADVSNEVMHAGGGVKSAAMRSVLEHQSARARVFFDRAVRALPAGDAKAFTAAEIMRAIYWDILLRIETAGFDVFSRVVRASRPVQAKLAIQTWLNLRRA
jgi:15-cis-phytoene synthase